MTRSPISNFFFFNDTATTEIYTLSLHDALPIYDERLKPAGQLLAHGAALSGLDRAQVLVEDEDFGVRSEEHTSELQSRLHLVCRLLLEKKKEPAASTTISRTAAIPAGTIPSSKC